MSGLIIWYLLMFGRRTRLLLLLHIDVVVLSVETQLAVRVSLDLDLLFKLIHLVLEIFLVTVLKQDHIFGVLTYGSIDWLVDETWLLEH